MEKYHCASPSFWLLEGNPILRTGLPGSMMVTVAVDWLGRFIDKKKDIPEMHDSLDWLIGSRKSCRYLMVQIFLQPSEWCALMDQPRLRTTGWDRPNWNRLWKSRPTYINDYLVLPCEYWPNQISKSPARYHTSSEFATLPRFERDQKYTKVEKEWRTTPRFLLESCSGYTGVFSSHAKRSRCQKPNSTVPLTDAAEPKVLPQHGRTGRKYLSLGLGLICQALGKYMEYNML